MSIFFKTYHLQSSCITLSWRRFSNYTQCHFKTMVTDRWDEHLSSKINSVFGPWGPPFECFLWNGIFYFLCLCTNKTKSPLQPLHVLLFQLVTRNPRSLPSVFIPKIVRIKRIRISLNKKKKINISLGDKRNTLFNFHRMKERLIFIPSQNQFIWILAEQTVKEENISKSWDF